MAYIIEGFLHVCSFLAVTFMSLLQFVINSICSFIS